MCIFQTNPALYDISDNSKFKLIISINGGEMSSVTVEWNIYNYLAEIILSEFSCNNYKAPLSVCATGIIIWNLIILPKYYLDFKMFTEGAPELLMNVYGGY